MAGKGGGAWKVAYADFVTAMMAFFLVMWICAQDQKLREEVAHYFSAPVHFFKDPVGTAKKPEQMGSMFETISTGNVPMADKVSLGKGRETYTSSGPTHRATKMVSDWLFNHAEASRYWREQAVQTRELLAALPETRERSGNAEEAAAQQLSQKMKQDFLRGVRYNSDGFYHSLFSELLNEVNWKELAEDVLRMEPHLRNQSKPRHLFQPGTATPQPGPLPSP